MSLLPALFERLVMFLELRSIIATFSIAVGLFLFGGSAKEMQGPPPPQPKTDKKIYPEPALPRLPRAGGKFRDPTFGTEILRVTDETTAAEGGTFYSYWPTFNSDNTKMLVRTSNDGTAHIYDFDAVNFNFGSRKQIPASPAGYPNVESANWSGLDPDTLYMLVGTRIYAYHPSHNKYSLVADMSREFGAGEFLWQLSVSRRDDNMFAFARRKMNASGGSDYVGYGVYSRAQRGLVLNQDVQKNDLDEVQIDKSGRWLVVKGEAKTTKGFSVRDLENRGARKELKYGEPDFAIAHSDNGNGVITGFNNYLNTIDRRNFQNLPPIVTTLKLGKDWSQGNHISHLADNDQWVLVSFYEVGQVQTPLGPFHNEIILLKTDGSESVVRVLHHRSVYKDYYGTPRANISRDGRFVAFTSNWGGRSRNDLFVARLNPPVPPPARSVAPSSNTNRSATPSPTPSQTRPRRVRP